MNTISRTFSAAALIIVEYTDNPILFVFLLTFSVAFLMKGLLKEPKPHKGDELATDRSTFYEVLLNDSFRKQ